MNQQRPTRPMPTRQPPAQAQRDSRFARAHDKAQEVVSAFAGPETRDRWYQEGVPLYILSVKLRKAGRFGDAWQVKMAEGSPDDPNPCILELASNGWRDEFFGELSRELSVDDSPIGPVLLSKVATASGQEAWDLIEPPF